MTAAPTTPAPRPLTGRWWFAPVPLARIAVVRVIAYLFIPVDVFLTTAWVKAHADVPTEWYAPLLIGRKPIARHDPDTPTSVTWGVFINAAMLGGALLILCGGAFALYYRGGDRKAKAEMDAVRHRNPFDPPAA